MYNKKLPYDKTSPEDIERYAKELEGKTFYDVINENTADSMVGETQAYYGSSSGKGCLGILLEKYYFGYEPNSDSAPDFTEAGVELKVTPYEKTKTKKVRAGERLVIGMIPNNEPIEVDFFSSHLLEKMQLMLLIFYLREKNKKRLDYRIDYVLLFSILSEACKEDLAIIKEDYNIIVSKIIQGKAHELSEGDTKYLGACTKGGTAKSSIQPQYYNSEVPAKRRAFSLKQGYMTYVINKYILKDVKTYDSACTAEELEMTDFDTAVVNKIKKYIGKTEKEIYQIFGINKNIKSKNHLAVCGMLGVKTDRVEEFEKANIKIKTIRVTKNGTPKESMSFPYMKINEFIKEDFENSEVYQFFSETRFLFVVFQEMNDGEFYLKGSKFWNMPISELEGLGYKEWKEIQDIFKQGVKFQKKAWGKTIRIENNLPKTSETSIFHLRPHAKKSAYFINGKHYGNGDESDMDSLPNGDKMTKQCFWLNKNYVKTIIQDLID